jgi:hypothetical protein
VRRLRVLIAQLPPESAYRRATGQQWTDELELAAVTVEVLHAIYVALLRFGGVKRTIKPLTVPRPGAQRRARPQRMSWLDLMREMADRGQAR